MMDTEDERRASEKENASTSRTMIGPELPPPTASAASTRPQIANELTVNPLIATTPEQVIFARSTGSNRSLPSTLRRVSKRAALATKKQIWDTNDASIVAAQSAVDQWEQGYVGLRNLLMAVGDSARGLYGAAKAGANGLEHGLLVPVRDWVLLPAFGGVEQIAGETVGFLQSEHAEQLARQSLDVARQVPFVGDNLLAPALCMGADILLRSWDIAQYPIPSPVQVRDSVDFVMTKTKWALSTAGREISLYVKRADANITRTLSHTQWKVLGSGPYATLDKVIKRDVVDHLCERYFSLTDTVARYELAAHIRAHNQLLYHDLVMTGLLRERGGDITAGDEWLSSCPSYHDLEVPFLLGDNSKGNNNKRNNNKTNNTSHEVFPLWFRLPYHNGERPGKDTPWIRFEKNERIKIENYYRSILEKREKLDNPFGASDGRRSTEEEMDDQQDAGQRNDKCAKWFNLHPEKDLLVDQKRHAISFVPCDSKGRNLPFDEEEDDDNNDVNMPPLLPKQHRGEISNECLPAAYQQRNVGGVPISNRNRNKNNNTTIAARSKLSLPPLRGLYRPTMWRFFGPGDELRRATWFLDTQWYGLQPYDEHAQMVLEDAYLFLKWQTSSSSSSTTNNTKRRHDQNDDNDDDDVMQQRREQQQQDKNILLTVQVTSPDGSEEQLVQFSSLTVATAIGKGLGSAMTLFKRRVYRGMYRRKDINSSSNGVVSPAMNAKTNMTTIATNNDNDISVVSNKSIMKESDLNGLQLSKDDNNDICGRYERVPDDEWIDLPIVEGPDVATNGVVDETETYPNSNPNNEVNTHRTITVLNSKLDDDDDDNGDEKIDTNDSEIPQTQQSDSPSFKEIEDTSEVEREDKSSLHAVVDDVHDDVDVGVDVTDKSSTELSEKVEELANDDDYDPCISLAFPLEDSDLLDELITTRTRTTTGNGNDNDNPIPETETVELNEVEEDNEDQDDVDQVDHLVLIVHGVGEMLQTMDFFGVTKLPTLIDCCGYLRKNHCEVLDEHFQQLNHTFFSTNKNGGTGTSTRRQSRQGRVEYLPIEWHEAFMVQSNRRLAKSTSSSSSSSSTTAGTMTSSFPSSESFITNTQTSTSSSSTPGYGHHRSDRYTIGDISLRTIPQMRQFANDSLMDVLYFMSPEHHDMIIDIVVNEMNFVVNKFRTLTGYKGNVSIVGHSLGSIITWDILDNQTKHRPSSGSIDGVGGADNDVYNKGEPSSIHNDTPELHSPASVLQSNDEYSPTQQHRQEHRRQRQYHRQGYHHQQQPRRAQEETCEPVSFQPSYDHYPQLEFNVDNAFMLGSPIAVFLMIRNQRRPLSSDFTLNGCNRIFNIFHPYDPVAYRIEPLIDPRNAEIEPKIMTHWHGGFRFQYKTKRLWRMIVEQTMRTQDSVVEKLESGMAALGLLDDIDIEDGNDIEMGRNGGDGAGNGTSTLPICGTLNRGQRIDYMLQEKEIENANEYVAALAAHSSYWLEKDLSLFIARQICRCALERKNEGGKKKKKTETRTKY